MKTVHADRHRLHHGRRERIDGQRPPCFEQPGWADPPSVSQGVDPFEQDPISRFRLRDVRDLRKGKRTAGRELASPYVKEGGHAVADTGVNALNARHGHLQRTPA